MDFTDSIRADFEWGSGYVAYRKIGEYLRNEKIGYLDGVMSSGPDSGPTEEGFTERADFTEFKVDLEKVEPIELIQELLARKWIAGEPTWFVNDGEFDVERKVGASDSERGGMGQE